MEKTYIGVDQEINGGMTTTAKIIRDAQVFGLIDETEGCRGWNVAQFEVLSDQVNAQWDRYGCLFSNLPDELATRHRRIHGEAFSRACAAGWSGENETIDDQ